MRIKEGVHVGEGGYFYGKEKATVYCIIVSGWSFADDGGVWRVGKGAGTDRRGNGRKGGAGRADS